MLFTEHGVFRAFSGPLPTSSFSRHFRQVVLRQVAQLITFPETELASTLENSTLFQKKPEYRKALQVVSVPERIVQFRVVWEDDKGQVSLIVAPREKKYEFAADNQKRSKSTVVSASSSTPPSVPTRVVSASTPR